MPSAGPGAYRRFVASVIIVLGALMVPASSVGQDEPEAPPTTVENAAESDMVFLAGERVVASQNTTDDLFAAGNMVDARGAGADHLFLAGSDVTVSDAQVSDIIAMGGEVRLNAANVADDVIIAGGNVIVDRGFDIGGTALIAGGRVRFEAPVGQDLRIGADDIYVNSTISGTARLSGETIVLGPDARVEGDLLYRGDDMTIDPAAVIEGSRTALPASEGYTAEDFGAGMGAFFLYFSLSMIISYFVIVVLLVIAMPGFMHSTSIMLRSTPLRALGIGVLYALIVPVLGIVLLWTGVGIPLAVLLFVASLALTPIAIAVTAHCIGTTARALITKKTEPAESTAARILWPLGGVLILFVLALIPFVGLLAMLFAMLFGLGALIRQASVALSVSESMPPPAPA